MIIKQVTISVENREGKLKEVMDILAAAGINVQALSMADTVTRLIVANPEETLQLLQENNYEGHLTDVIRITVPSQTGSLAKMLLEIAEEKINLEYMYAMANEPGMIIRPSDVERTNEILKKWEK